MITVERTLHLPVPVDTLFDYLADFTTTEVWDPGTVTTTRVDGGPVRQGTRFRNVSTFRGRTTELDYVLAAYEPARHLVFEGTNRTVDAADDMTFRPADGGTELTYRARFAFKRAFRFTEPFLRRGFERIADETVAQMRRTLPGAVGR